MGLNWGGVALGRNSGQGPEHVVGSPFTEAEERAGYLLIPVGLLVISSYY